MARDASGFRPSYQLRYSEITTHIHMARDIPIMRPGSVVSELINLARLIINPNDRSHGKNPSVFLADENADSQVQRCCEQQMNVYANTTEP